MSSKIGVFGSAYGDFDPEVLKKSHEIGATIAKRGHIVITGGCPGIPHEAAIGAYKITGKTLAFSPARDIDEHKAFGFPTDSTTEFIFIPKDYLYAGNRAICAKYRNVTSVAACDAAIFIGGRIGTLNEFTIAYDTGKIIGILDNSGGISHHVKLLVKDLNKKTDSKIIYSKEPKELVEKVLGVLT